MIPCEHHEGTASYFWHKNSLRLKDDPHNQSFDVPRDTLGHNLQKCLIGKNPIRCRQNNDNIIFCKNRKRVILVIMHFTRFTLFLRVS